MVASYSKISKCQRVCPHFNQDRYSFATLLLCTKVSAVAFSCHVTYLALKTVIAKMNCISKESKRRQCLPIYVMQCNKSRHWPLRFSCADPGDTSVSVDLFTSLGSAQTYANEIYIVHSGSYLKLFKCRNEINNTY